MTRIIAGERKGFHLKDPKGNRIRPTTDRTKEWIYSVLYNVSDTTVLDLFCGAGNLGLEALSRGASNCVFVDNSSEAISLAGYNARRVQYDARVTLIKNDAVRFLKTHSGQYDLIIADPPYRYTDGDELFAEVGLALEEHGRFVYESGVHSLEPEAPTLVLLQEKAIGSTIVKIYGKK